MFQDVLENFANSQLLPYDYEAAKIFESLRKQKIRIGTQDLRIAATAISNNMTLLSRNMVDFQKVPGLKVEDWTKEIR
jgi:tRNA(fMet)-specific endonuclease VapC